jgi:hypothetical protein
LADQTKIDAVISYLPTWREDVTDWDDSKIASLLDTYSGNIYKVVRLFWVQRVSDTTALTDVSDVGASRPLSQTFQHALEMLKYWDKIAGSEGAMASSVGKIKQRYKRYPGYGLNPYGGVYARTD